MKEFSLRSLRISAFSALKGSLNAEDAEIRRERGEDFQITTLPIFTEAVHNPTNLNVLTDEKADIRIFFGG